MNIIKMLGKKMLFFCEKCQRFKSHELAIGEKDDRKCEVVICPTCAKVSVIAIFFGG